MLNYTILLPWAPHRDLLHSVRSLPVDEIPDLFREEFDNDESRALLDILRSGCGVYSSDSAALQQSLGIQVYDGILAVDSYTEDDLTQIWLLTQGGAFLGEFCGSWEACEDILEKVGRWTAM